MFKRETNNKGFCQLKTHLNLQQQTRFRFHQPQKDDCTINVGVYQSKIWTLQSKKSSCNQNMDPTKTIINMESTTSWSGIKLATLLNKIIIGLRMVTTLGMYPESLHNVNAENHGNASHVGVHINHYPLVN